MKVIKKYFKVVMCFMAFALCSFLMVFAPTMTALSVEAAISDYARTISSVKMPKQVDVQNEDKFIIPFLTGSFASNGYSIKVVDPAGYVHTAKITGSNQFAVEESVTQNGNDYFALAGTAGVQVAALTNGKYKVVYVVNKDGKDFYSSEYEINVLNVSYELSFEKNDGLVNLVKPEVKTSSNANDRIEIPVPVAKIIGSESDAGKALVESEISVSHNGTSLTLNAQNSDFVEVDGKYYIQPSKAGVYKIQYTYKRGVNRPTKTISIKVSDDFVEPTEFKVSTKPTFDKFELGETGITLPKLTAKNEYESDVAYNVTSIKIVKESDSNIKQELTNNNHTFDMTLSAFGLTAATDTYDKLKGNYEITYTLVDAYGNVATYAKRIEGVTVSSKPTIKMVYDYTDATANPESAETELHNKYGYDEIVLPAAYAEDLVSKSNELIVVRYLRNVNTSTIYYVDNLKYNSAENKLDPVTSNEPGYNHSGDPNLGQINKAVAFRFDEGEAGATYAGTYQLEYRVIATNIAKRESTLTVSGSSKYTFTVDKLSQSEIKTTTPTIEITSGINEVVDREDEITVKFTATDDDDTRLKNTVYYYYGDKSADTIADDILNRIDLYNKDRSMHVLDNPAFLTNLGTTVDTPGSEFEAYTGITQAKLSEDKSGYVVKFATEGANSTATKAVIVAISYNDYNKVDVDTKTLIFKDTNETDAPELQDNIVWNDFNEDGTLANVNKAKIGETIVLPDVTYADADNNLQTVVYYYIDSPLNEKIGLNYSAPNSPNYDGFKVVGGKIDIEMGGKYVVVYTATDAAGNTTITYFTFDVESVSEPTLEVNPTGENITISGNNITAEAGSTITFDTILRSGDSKNIISGNVKVSVNNNGLSYRPSGKGKFSYIFESVGTYTLTFKADDVSTPKEYYVTINPRKLEWLGNFEVPEHAPKGSKVFLPDIAATDNAVVSVKVTSSNSSASEIVVNKEYKDGDITGSFWCFETGTSKATYTVTYTATTADATIEKKFEIKVGDWVDPTIKFNHKAELQKDIVYDGSNQIEIKFDVKKTGNDKYFKIIATSNGKTIYSYDLGLNITDITDGSSIATTLGWGTLDYKILKNGEEMSPDKEDENLYLISEKGTYTIKLSVEDDNKNETVENIVFKVVDKADIEEENDTVVGIVLIVISLVVLAGVILYFVLTGKKSGNKKAKKVVKSAKAKAEKVKAEKETKVEEAKAESEVVETEEEKVETPVEEKTEETSESNEAKEGEIEE